MRPVFASLFAGGGGVECGAVAAGCDLAWAVEHDAEIADVHRANHKSKLLVRRVQDVDPKTLDRPDVLWASPPCPNFSVAKAGRAETEDDLSMARAVAGFLSVLTPPCFILENVPPYAASCSFQIICQALDALGYWYGYEVVNAADCGVPQTRRRLILRAVRDAMLPPLPAPVEWRGWYGAVEDLIPSLPESKFANWQLARLPESLSSCLVDIRAAHEPATSVVTDDRPSHAPKAFIIDGRNSRTTTEEPWTLRGGEEPVFTVTSSDGTERHRAFVEGAPKQQPCLSPELAHREWLEHGRVVAMSPRALARFQSVPDWYVLPDKNRVACRVIGNMVPPLLAETLIRQMVESLR